MSDYHADSTIVARIIGIYVEVRSLKDSGREANLICGGIVVSIHSLRRHAPLLAVNRFAPLRVLVLSTEFACILDVLPIRELRVNGKSAIVLPCVGIADFHLEAVELHEGIHLCAVAHPVEGCYMFAKGYFKIIHKVEHLLLRLCGEVFLHIELSYCLAKQAIRHCKCTLPAWLLLLCTRHGAREHLKVGFSKFVAERTACARHILKCHIVADFLIGERLEQ